MKWFSDEELEMIKVIRELLRDGSIDEYECLEAYIEICEA